MVNMGSVSTRAASGLARPVINHGSQWYIRMHCFNESEPERCLVVYDTHLVSAVETSVATHPQALHTLVTKRISGVNANVQNVPDGADLRPSTTSFTPPELLLTAYIFE